MSIEELLNRRYNAGSRVTNCVAHMSMKFTDRPKDCKLCAYDVSNQLSLAVGVNEWLNKWKDDATKILEKL